MPTARSNLRPAVRPKIVKKKTNKFVRIEADLNKRMKVRWACLPLLARAALGRLEFRNAGRDSDARAACNVRRGIRCRGCSRKRFAAAPCCAGRWNGGGGRGAHARGTRPYCPPSSYMAMSGVPEGVNLDARSRPCHNVVAVCQQEPAEEDQRTQHEKVGLEGAGRGGAAGVRANSVFHPRPCAPEGAPPSPPAL